MPNGNDSNHIIKISFSKININRASFFLITNPELINLKSFQNNKKSWNISRCYLRILVEYLKNINQPKYFKIFFTNISRILRNYNPIEVFQDITNISRILWNYNPIEIFQDITNISRILWNYYPIIQMPCIRSGDNVSSYLPSITAHR